MKKLYLVRHSETSWQEPTAPLTQKWFTQSSHLVDFLLDKWIQSIVSSPYLRAIQTIEPLAKALELEITTNAWLIEKCLSSQKLPDWKEKLKASFDDIDLQYEGWESSRVAMEREIAVMNELSQGTKDTTVVVTHGALMTLILKYFDNHIWFQEWQDLKNPDIYEITIHENKTEIRKILEATTINEILKEMER